MLAQCMSRLGRTVVQFVPDHGFRAECELCVWPGNSSVGEFLEMPVVIRGYGLFRDLHVYPCLP